MQYSSLDAVKDRINTNYECMKELEQLIPFQKTDEEKLELISLIGKMYAEYVTGIYSSNSLENQILEIGQGIGFESSEMPQPHQMLIVMSEAGMIGGHSVLVHNWMKWDDENRYSVVFTNIEEAYVPDFIKRAVGESGGDIYYLSGSHMEKAKELLELSQRFQAILLFTHMEDVVPILAYGNRNWKIPVYFYNHADFKFSFGFSVADAVMNLFPYDVEKTIRYRGVASDESIHIQFPGQGNLEKKRERVSKESLRQWIAMEYGVIEEKLIVSMGDDFKYGSVIGYEFDAYVEEVLRQSREETAFLIIGADRDNEKWIRLEEKTQGRARILGMMPRSEAEKIIAAADLFVVSFPMMAAGKTIAEQAGVPCLCLDVIGRGLIGEGDIRVVSAVDELIEKSLDILEGNKDKYLYQPTSMWTKQIWKDAWRKVYTDISRHKRHPFQPERYLEKQEYINCQLMQKRAARVVSDYIVAYHRNDLPWEEIVGFDRKYEMGIAYYDVMYVRAERDAWINQCLQCQQFSEKHLQLYLTAIKWIETKQIGKRLDSYLGSMGYRTVAIYGMSYMGERLFRELADSSVEVLYGIDRNAESICSELEVLKPSDVFGDVDVILNTTMIDNRKILEDMTRKDITMLRFADLLERIVEAN